MFALINVSCGNQNRNFTPSDISSILCYCGDSCMFCTGVQDIFHQGSKKVYCIMCHIYVSYSVTENRSWKQILYPCLVKIINNAKFPFDWSKFTSFVSVCTWIRKSGFIPSIKSNQMHASRETVWPNKPIEIVGFNSVSMFLLLFTREMNYNFL